MRKRSKLAVGALAALVVTGVAVAAFGGYKSTSGQVVLGSNYAWGSLGAVRNSGDGNQDLHCEVDSYSTSGPSIFCYAKDATGATRSCWSNTSNLANAARAVVSDSYLYFQFNTSTGECTAITVDTSSEWAPKAP